MDQNATVRFHDPRSKERFNKHGVCPRCFRPVDQCICSRIRNFENRIKVVILQHPQEQYKVLNSARLARLSLKNCSINVGLSWPNFKAVAGETEMPSQWGILFLKNGPETQKAPIVVYGRHKQSLADCSVLRGIIAIDGTWKQAKTLWWRNPWFTRLNRISLNSSHPSMRAQVRAEGLSTIEAIAFTLECLGERKGIPEYLRKSYRELIVCESVRV